MSGLNYYRYDNNQNFNNYNSPTNFTIFDNSPDGSGVISIIENHNDTNKLYKTYGFSKNEYIALKIKGYFTPDVTGTWGFKLGDSIPNDDLSYIWIGNNALNPTPQNANGMTYYYSSMQTINVNLVANQKYPILIYWGQSYGGFVFSIGIIPPNGKITYDGSKYYSIYNGLTYYRYNNNPKFNNYDSATNFSIFNSPADSTGLVSLIKNNNNTKELSATYGFTSYQYIALKLKGFFTPNITGTWGFKLGDTNPNDDLCYIWIGNNALNPTPENANGMTYYYSSMVTVNVSLVANQTYPILIYWGQSWGGLTFSIGIIPPNGKITYDGSLYYSDKKKVIKELEYKFDKLSIVNNIVNNSVSKLYNGTLINNPVLNPENNIGLFFLGKNKQYIQVNDSLITDNNGLTFSFWFQADPANGDWTRIFDFGNGVAMDNIIILFNNGYMSFNTFNGNVSYLKTNIIPNVLTNNWYHITWVLTYPKGWKIYFNGNLIYTDLNGLYPNPTTRKNMYIGKSNWESDPYFTGTIYDFKIFKNDLSDPDILDIYNKSSNLFLALLNCNYQLNQKELSCYQQRYPKDLNGLNNQQLQNHWSTIGCNQKRNNQCLAPQKISGLYEYQGCYNDNMPRALVNFRGDVKSVNECANIAENNKEILFGVQYYGECWTGNDESNAKKYGENLNGSQCGIMGKAWTNNLYKRNITFPPPLPPVPQLKLPDFSESFQNSWMDNAKYKNYMIMAIIFIIFILLMYYYGNIIFEFYYWFG